MIMDSKCTVMASNTALCVNQDALLLGTSEEAGTMTTTCIDEHASYRLALIYLCIHFV